MKHMEKYGEELAWAKRSKELLVNKTSVSRVIFKALDDAVLNDARFDELESCISIFGDIVVSGIGSYSKAKEIIKMLMHIKGYNSKIMEVPSIEVRNNKELYSLNWCLKYEIEYRGKKVELIVCVNCIDHSDEFDLSEYTGMGNCQFVKETEVKEVTSYILKCEVNK